MISTIYSILTTLYSSYRGNKFKNFRLSIKCCLSKNITEPDNINHKLQDIDNNEKNIINNIDKLDIKINKLEYNLEHIENELDIDHELDINKDINKDKDKELNTNIKKKYILININSLKKTDL